MTSVFYTQESAFMDEPVLFIYRKEGGRQSEQSKKSEIRITKLWCNGPAYIAELYREELKKSGYQI